jgi:hypothetical protein
MGKAMDKACMRMVARGVVLSLAVLPLTVAFAQMSSNGPVELEVDNLKTPLGIDDPAP